MDRILLWTLVFLGVFTTLLFWKAGFFKRLFFKDKLMNTKFLWAISFLVSLTFTVLLIFIWIEQSKIQHLPENQLTNHAEEVQAFLEKEWESGQNDFLGEETIHIPTGFFIQSLQFVTASDVNLTGYIWQRLPKGFSEEEIEPGFILPEQVNSSGGTVEKMREKILDTGEKVILWYFEADLRQKFHYKDYPFDDKTVWVRLWSRNFGRNVILVPDFQSYKATGPADIFGIEKEIVLSNWEMENVYYDYQMSSYDNTFGHGAYKTQRVFPNLYYNIVIKRNFRNAFIVNLIPLFVVAMLLFAALMTVTADEKKAGILGFSTSGVLGTTSALFFVVMLAHIQLRESFSSGVVYLEYFYFMMYVVILVVSVNTYLFSTRQTDHFSVIGYRDNLVPKLLFWPAILGTMLAITLTFFPIIL